MSYPPRTKALVDKSVLHTGGGISFMRLLRAEDCAAIENDLIKAVAQYNETSVVNNQYAHQIRRLDDENRQLKDRNEELQKKYEEACTEIAELKESLRGAECIAFNQRVMRERALDEVRGLNDICLQKQKAIEARDLIIENLKNARSVPSYVNLQNALEYSRATNAALLEDLAKLSGRSEPETTNSVVKQLVTDISRLRVEVQIIKERLELVDDQHE